MQTLFLAIMLCIAAIANAAHAQTTSPAPLEKPPDTMEARVQACIGCHGQHGKGINDVYFPRLAGKPAGYLYNQLVAFRDGRRRYAPMNYLLAYLPDEYLREIAKYYADAQVPFAPTPPPVASQDILKRGRQITLNGDASRKIPACSACHGPDLSGREPGIPGLLGLRTDYISAQLGAWRYGIRTALAPDCMQLIAARMTEEDVTAVSAWLSAMPIPDNTQPLRRDSSRLPLECGSQK